MKWHADANALNNLVLFPLLPHRRPSAACRLLLAACRLPSVVDHLPPAAIPLLTTHHALQSPAQVVEVVSHPAHKAVRDLFGLQM